MTEEDINLKESFPEYYAQINPEEVQKEYEQALLEENWGRVINLHEKYKVKIKNLPLTVPRGVVDGLYRKEIIDEDTYKRYIKHTRPTKEEPKFDLEKILTSIDKDDGYVESMIEKHGIDEETIQRAYESLLTNMNISGVKKLKEKLEELNERGIIKDIDISPSYENVQKGYSSLFKLPNYKKVISGKENYNSKIEESISQIKELYELTKIKPDSKIQRFYAKLFRLGEIEKIKELVETLGIKPSKRKDITTALQDRFKHLLANYPIEVAMNYLEEINQLVGFNINMKSLVIDVYKNLIDGYGINSINWKEAINEIENFTGVPFDNKLLQYGYKVFFNDGDIDKAIDLYNFKGIKPNVEDPSILNAIKEMYKKMWIKMIEEARWIPKRVYPFSIYNTFRTKLEEAEEFTGVKLNELGKEFIQLVQYGYKVFFNDGDISKAIDLYNFKGIKPNVEDPSILNAIKEMYEKMIHSYNYIEKLRKAEEFTHVKLDHKLTQRLYRRLILEGNLDELKYQVRTRKIRLTPEIAQEGYSYFESNGEIKKIKKLYQISNIVPKLSKEFKKYLKEKLLEHYKELPHLKNIERYFRELIERSAYNDENDFIEALGHMLLKDAPGGI